MPTDLELVIDCQQRLLEALDAREAEALERATADLSKALDKLRSNGAVYDVTEDQLEHAMKQSNAARIRVNVLSEWTRQRIDRLSEVRCGPSATYGNKRFYEPIG